MLVVEKNVVVPHGAEKEMGCSYAGMRYLGVKGGSGVLG